MSAPATIRPATRDDRDEILSCLRDAFAAYEAQYTVAGYADTVLTPETLEERLRMMTIFVAVDSEQRIVGTIGCSVNGDEGHLRGMAVRPQSQGSGVAGALLAAAEDHLRGAGCERVTLDTTRPLLKAIRFYESQGYRPTGMLRDFFGMDLLEYAKALR